MNLRPTYVVLLLVTVVLFACSSSQQALWPLTEPQTAFALLIPHYRPDDELNPSRRQYLVDTLKAITQQPRSDYLTAVMLLTCYFPEESRAFVIDSVECHRSDFKDVAYREMLIYYQATGHLGSARAVAGLDTIVRECPELPTRAEAALTLSSLNRDYFSLMVEWFHWGEIAGLVYYAENFPNHRDQALKIMAEAVPDTSLHWALRADALEEIVRLDRSLAKELIKKVYPSADPGTRDWLAPCIDQLGAGFKESLEQQNR